MSEDSDRLADEQYSARSNGTLENVLNKAAKQLRAKADGGTPTVVGLVNLRQRDPFSIAADRIADALYGPPTANPRTAGITGRSGPGHQRYRSISAIATLGFQTALPPVRERGMQLSDVSEEIQCMATLRIFHNAGAQTPLDPGLLRAARAEQHFMGKKPNRKVLVSRWTTVANWSGYHESEPADKSIPGIAATGLRMMRRAVAREVAEAGQGLRTSKHEAKSEDEVVVNRHGVVLLEEPAPIDETWARYAELLTQPNGGPNLAGSRTKLSEILEQVRDGVDYETITREAQSCLLPGNDPTGAVKAAAAYTALVLMNEEDLPEPAGKIERVRGRCGGKPVLKGTRRRVSAIFEMMRNGMTLAEIAGSTGQDAETVQEAITYGLRALARNTDRRTRKSEGEGTWPARRTRRPAPAAV